MADDQSEDGARSILLLFSDPYPFVSLLESPKRRTPAGLNLGIAQAKGSVVCSFVTHAENPRDHLSECARATKGRGADCVGGQVVATARTCWLSCLRCCLPFI